MRGWVRFEVLLAVASLSLLLVRASPRPPAADDDNDDGDDLPEVSTQPQVVNNFHMEALPTEFNTFDIDGDGKITLLELSNVTETSEDAAFKPFESADVDGNDALSKTEFLEAPWVFHVPEDIANPVKEDEQGHLVIEKVADGEKVSVEE